MISGNLLVIGAGQLGNELMRLSWSADINIIQASRDSLDITDQDAVFTIIEHHKPFLVINAAAYTAVDKAESDPQTAFAANRDGPAHLARACSKFGSALVHVSTDYVFDGNQSTAYTEDTPVVPLGVYGQSKEAGEQLVRKTLPRSLIIRTSWVFSAHGNNFVKTMLRLGSERDELRIVNDQHGCPTSAADLAKAIQHAALACLADEDYWGTYHYCGAGQTTWYGFAKEIFRVAEKFHLPVPILYSIPTKEFPTPARRPAYSVLDTAKYTTTFGQAPRDWKDCLQEVIFEINSCSA